MSAGLQVSDWEFVRDGFSVVPDVIPARSVERLIAALGAYESRGEAARERGGRGYALRNLMRDVPAVAELAAGEEMRAAAGAVLGAGAFAVRALLFDKRPGANWKVAWHQDLSIAVKGRVEDAAGFGP